MNREEIVNKVITIIVEQTGNDEEEITLDTYLEDDLGITGESDLPRIIRKINQEFDIQINPQDAADDASTIRELVMMVIDETELG